MERVTFHGEFVHVDGIELDVVHGRREPRNVPIMIGATGDQMMEMTGEIADGCGVELLRAAGIQHQGARSCWIKARRKPVARWMTWTARSWWSVRWITITIKPSIPRGSCSPNTWRSSRTSPRPLGCPRMWWNRSNPSWVGRRPTSRSAEAKHLVPEDLILRITASGTPEEARAKVDEYRKHGCTCPILYPVGGDVKLLIDTFAQT